MARKIISNQCKRYLLTREHGIQSSLRRQLPGEGNGSPLQYSCLENSMDRGAWRAADHGVAESGTWLSNWHGEDSWAVGAAREMGLWCEMRREWSEPCKWYFDKGFCIYPENNRKTLKEFKQGSGMIKISFRKSCFGLVWKIDSQQIHSQNECGQSS